MTTPAAGGTSTEGRGVLVVGQLGRDLVLRAESWPEEGGSSPVAERRELLGGKGANQAVGLRQLGAGTVVVLGVVGEDGAGEQALAQARASGLDVAHVVRRGATALLVDVVAPGGRRLLEHVPSSALLTPDDVRRAAAAFAGVDTVCLQLQQPAEALLVAADLATRHGARLVLDGAPPRGARDRLLERADVLRADGVEAAAWTGRRVDGPDDAAAVADQLLGGGASVVALEVPGIGDHVAWQGGAELVPYGEDPVVDPTGGGDAFVAGLVVALRRGAHPREAARRASRAAAATVGLLGGRPDLEPAAGDG